MAIRFDSNRAMCCDYCSEVIRAGSEQVIVGQPSGWISVYHRDCDAIRKAERSHKYWEFLNSLEPMRKETL